MRILDKNTDFYDYLANVYIDTKVSPYTRDFSHELGDTI